MAWGIKSGYHTTGLVLTVMILTVASGLLPEPASATSSPPAVHNMVFILDASGSMWGLIDKRAQIAIAKEVMTQLVNDLPDGAPVGLTVYGHRRKGDCNDVQVLFLLGPLNKTEVLKTIASLNPQGQNPNDP